MNKLENPILNKKRLEEARRFHEVVRPVTANEVYSRVGLLFLLLFAAAALGWQADVLFGPSVALMIMMVSLVGVIGVAITSMVMYFKRTIPGPGLALVGSVSQGLLIGVFSKFMEYSYPGLVVQASLATLTVTGVVYLLYRSGKFRTTPRGRKILKGMLWGYFAFSILNLVLIFTGVVQSPWGVRGMTVMGIPLGLIIGLFAVGLAVYSMVASFEDIQEVADGRADRKLAWWTGYGLIVNVVWLYIEILRILAILRGND